MSAAQLSPVSLRRHPKWQWERGALMLGRSATETDVLIDARTLSTHISITGASGLGKSSLLENFVRQWLLALDGDPKSLVLIDPHGTLVESILRWIATFKLDKHRRIHLIDPSSDDIIGINPLRLRSGIDPAFIAQTLKNAIMGAWEDDGAKPQLEESLLAICYVLAVLGWTLLESELLADIADPLGVREFVINAIQHPQMRRIWATYDALPAAKVEEKLGAAVRRLLAFLLPQSVRRMLSQRDRVIDFRQAIDNGDIILINLSYGNGRISEDESTLLGRLIVADIFLSVLGRPPKSAQTLLIIDECQRFLTKDIARILDQARKFSLSLVLATQHLGHLREAGEPIFRSVMTNTRTKVVFGGLDDDDATFMARNLFRGVFDLEVSKATLEKPTVVGQDYDWLASEATAQGSAHAEGANWSRSDGVAINRSATTSWARTVSDSDTSSRSTTRSRASTLSSSNTEQWSHIDSNSTGSSSSASCTSSTSRSVGLTQDFPGWIRSRNSRISSPRYGAMIADTDSDTRGIGSTFGQTASTGTAASFGGAYSTTWGTARGTAEMRGSSHSHGIAETVGRSITDGITNSTSFTQGGSRTETTTETDTTGRAQTLRSVLRTLPTQTYSLQELQYYGSVLLGGLPVGEAIAKIGNQPPVRVKTLRIKPGWASDLQVERLKERLATASPYVTPLPEARANYLAHRQNVMQQILGYGTPPQLPVSIKDGDHAAPGPKEVDDDWG